MWSLNDGPHPIGEPKSLPEVEAFLNKAADQWDQEGAVEIARWWQIWKWGRKVNLNRVTKFLLMCLDELISIVDEFVDNGPDKKATVLFAIDRLYEYVIKEALPIWLKPFGGYVKQYIVYTLISNAIDWIVYKYKNGAWRNVIKPDVEEPKE